MGREFELKYRCTPETITAIREKFGPFTKISMETAYYDTPDRAFSDLRWTLRRRYENGKSVCTVKIPLSDGSRGEWETECGTITEAIPELCKLGAPSRLQELTQAGLIPTCAARFTRLVAALQPESAEVELALDQGLLMGGGKELPFAEVEVELKSGSEKSAIAFAERLAAEFSLVPEPKSKVQRALELTKPSP